MAEADKVAISSVAEWESYRERLTAIAALRLQPALLNRITAEDVVQQTFLNALKRPEFWLGRADVPVFAKLRLLLGQTLSDYERHYLACQKRDVYQEQSLDEEIAEADQTGVRQRWELFSSTVTSPRTKLARQDRQRLLRQVLEELSDKEREILEMRHFEALSNTECAGVLGISADAASIRYVRALKKMQQILSYYSELRP